MSSIFLYNAKIASVVPLDKGKPSKYRPVSILNAFSWGIEKVIKNRLVSYFNKYFSPFLSAYIKSYSTKQALIRWLDEYRQKLDKSFIVGAILMGLSKVFDCLRHDLIIAQLATPELIYSYLKSRKQCVQINNTYIIETIIKLFPAYRKVLYSGLLCSTFHSMISFSSSR